MVAQQALVPFVLAAISGAPAFLTVQHSLDGFLAQALGDPASAQDLPAFERQVGLERIEDPESSVAVVFEGFVSGPDGTPAEGSVVVSSAGGQAVTDASGSFRLEARVPLEAESVQITAVGGGEDLLASRLVALPAASGTVPVGSLELALGTTCSPEWLPTFGWEQGLDGGVDALAVYDDGSGPALYAGGGFTAAGGEAVNYVAKWDGSIWTALGSGMNNVVSALTVYDDGGGPALYAGGIFTTAGGVAARRIAKWDGSIWTALGSGMNVSVAALTVYDDGGGPALYAGGGFTTAGGVAASRIAKWDGSIWTALGSGINGGVWALTVYDDGGGPALYAGGQFITAGGVAASRIAKWDGSNWTALGSGISGAFSAVHALTVHDDGGGPALYAGGEFTLAGGMPANAIAKWDGTSWTTLGSGMPGIVLALTVHDDGGGPALHAGGNFITAGGVAANYIAKWDGTNWAPLGSGMGMNGIVNALAVYDDGGGPALFAGGLFGTAGGEIVNRISKWANASWTALGDSGGVDNDVEALAVHDDGGGPALYAGGNFVTAGGVTLNHIGKWDGSIWTALGSGMGGGAVSTSVDALAAYDDGGGAALYAGGNFTTAGGTAANGIAKWDGSSWTALGSGTSGVSAMTVFDDGAGPALYLAMGNGVSRWDGLGLTPVAGVNGSLSVVSALAVHDDGSGPALYVGGSFDDIGGTIANNIAKWAGTNWTALGSGTGGGVYSLTVYDDGSGPALYAGGNFASAGPVAVFYIARWDGTSWTALGSGMSDWVLALTAYDDGSGPALYAAGTFTTAGGVAANRIAKWDGTSWAPLGSGMNGGVGALTVYDDDGGPALCAGGSFSNAIDSGDCHLAKWGCATPAPKTYCTAGTSASGCQALLSASGVASATAPSGFSLLAVTVEGSKDGQFFFGANGQQANPWGNGTSYQCVVPPLHRAGALAGIGTNGACDGAFSQDLNSRWCPTCPKPNHNPGAGAVVQAQLWYRDPASTSNQTTSLSDAIEFVVAP